MVPVLVQSPPPVSTSGVKIVIVGTSPDRSLYSRLVVAGLLWSSRIEDDALLRHRGETAAFRRAASVNPPGSRRTADACQLPDCSERRRSDGRMCIAEWRRSGGMTQSFGLHNGATMPCVFRPLIFCSSRPFHSAAFSANPSHHI